MPKISPSKRLAIFFFYDKDGIVDDYVPYLLTALRPYAGTIVFISNGPLTKTSEHIATVVSDRLIIRDNIGFDVGAYKDALNAIGFDTLANYDEAILLNHTFYGPIFPFSEMFDEMESRNDDFWGISVHKALTPNPMTGVGTLPAHLQSHFIAVRKPLLTSASFKDYWERMPEIVSYEHSVLRHESFFTAHFARLGYNYSSYIDPDLFKTPYPIFIEVFDSIPLRSPILKRRLFFHTPEFYSNTGTDLATALNKMKAASEYDTTLIWRNIVREARPRTLANNSGLLRILADESVQAPHQDRKLALLVHVRRAEALGTLLEFGRSLPPHAALIVTSCDSDELASIERILALEKHFSSTSALLLDKKLDDPVLSVVFGCRDIIDIGGYELVCRIHDSPPNLPLGLTSSFRRHLLENLVGSTGYVQNLIKMFAEEPWIGLAFPPTLQSKSIQWPSHPQEVARILAAEDIKTVPEHQPLAPFGAMFWFRPPALRKLFDGQWKLEEFGGEASREALLEAIVPIAMDTGYSPMQVLSVEHAQMRYVQLDHVVAQSSAKYTVRGAFWELLEATKRAIQRRAPWAVPILGPIYRLIFPVNLRGS